MIEFKGRWSEREKEIWKNTNWLARDYKELPVEDDIIEGIATFYNLTEKINVKAKFVKMIRPNPIYPPYYKLQKQSLPKDILDKISNELYVSLSYDGHDFNGYQIHDRIESQDVYNLLSR